MECPDPFALRFTRYNASIARLQFNFASLAKIFLPLFCLLILSACDLSPVDSFSESLNQGREDQQADINSVNKAPSFTASGDISTVSDGSSFKQDGWARDISDNNDSSQSLRFVLVKNTNPDLFSIQPYLELSTGSLRFSAYQGVSGSSDIAFVLIDDGGTENGGMDRSTAFEFRITLVAEAINHAPVFTVGPDITVESDSGAVEFPHWLINAHDGDNSSQRLKFEIISNSNPGLFLTQPWVSFPSLTLRFQPAPGYEGTAQIKIRARDNGGTASGGSDTSETQTFLIRITKTSDKINHAPSFRVGPDVKVKGSDGSVALPAWALDVYDGDHHTQKLRFHISKNSEPELFKIQPWISYPSKTLRFTPKDCVKGTAVLSVYLQDNGGVRQGGIDRSEEQTFRITITCPEPNHPPSFTVGPDITVPADIGDAEFSGWATDVQDGDSGVQRLHFKILTNDKPGLFANQPRVSYPSRTLRFTPKADAVGTATLSVQLIDNGEAPNSSAPQLFRITITEADTAPVNHAPMVANISLETAYESPVNTILLGTDQDHHELEYTLVENPRYGTAHIDKDALTYIPNTGFSGIDEFHYIASDGLEKSNIGKIRVQVLDKQNHVPVAEPLEFYVYQTESLQLTLQGADQDNDDLSYHLLNRPANGYLSGQAPHFEFTPISSFSGELSFEYFVNDGLADSEPAIVKIKVLPVNQPPTAVSQWLVILEDKKSDLLLAGSDPEGNRLHVNIVTPPQNGTISGQNPQFLYTPNPEFNGSDLLTFRVNDGELDSDIATVYITVEPVNDPPEALAKNYRTNEETPVNILLEAQDKDSDQLNWVVVSDPGNGTLSGSAPNLIYTPNKDYTGSDAFKFRVDDEDNSSNIATVGISVSGNNDSPVAHHQHLVLNEDTVLSINLSGTDPEADPLDFQILSQPSNGTLSGTAPNISYIPKEDFAGSDYFEFSVNDGSDDSAPARIDLTIKPVNDAPTGKPLSLNTDEEIPLDITLSGEDPDGDTLNYIIGRQPLHGTLSGGPAQWQYLPDKDYYGLDSFSYSVSDGELLSDDAVVEITVNAGNDKPVAESAEYTVAEEQSLVFTLSGDDPDGDEIGFKIMTPPRYGSFSGEFPTLIYTPNTGFTGTDSLQFIVNDGHENSNPATVTIQVTSMPNSVPVANAGEDFIWPVNSAIPLSGENSSDEDGDILSYLWSIEQSPPGAKVFLSTKSSATPKLLTDVPGEYVISLIVNDGMRDSAPDSVLITVVEPNSTPTADAGPDLTIEAGKAIVLDGSKSHDPEEDPLSYSWVISDGPPGWDAKFSDIHSAQTQFFAYTPGRYTVSLTVNDGYQQSLADQTTVTVVNATQNHRPVAIAQYTIAYNELEEFTLYLDGSKSYDPDGDLLNYQWILLDHHPDYPDTLSDPLSATPNLVSQPWDHRLQLIVSDGESFSDPVILHIPENASFTPIVDFDTSTENREVGEAVVLDVFAYDFDHGSTLEYSWSFVKKPAASTVSISDPNSSSIQFELDKPGTYQIRMTVDDGTPNGRITLEKTIYANSPDNAAPIADAGEEFAVTIGQVPVRVPLDGTASYDPDGDQLSYFWELLPPEGSRSKLDSTTIPQPSFTADIGGDYFIYLYVSDGFVQSEEFELLISVERDSDNSLPVAEAGNNLSIPAGNEITLDGSGSYDDDADPISYFWQLLKKPAGSLAMLETVESQKVRPRFVPDIPGDYMFGLSVNDYASVSATDTAIVEALAANRSPYADTGQSSGDKKILSTGHILTLDGSRSYDEDGDPISYRWSLVVSQDEKFGY